MHHPRIKRGGCGVVFSMDFFAPYKSYSKQDNTYLFDSTCRITLGSIAFHRMLWKPRKPALWRVFSFQDPLSGSNKIPFPEGMLGAPRFSGQERVPLCHALRSSQRPALPRGQNPRTRLQAVRRRRYVTFRQTQWREDLALEVHQAQRQGRYAQHRQFPHRYPFSRTMQARRSQGVAARQPRPQWKKRRRPRS